MVKCWHGCLFKGSASEATEATGPRGRQRCPGRRLVAFGADFEIWKYKRPA